MNVSLEIKEILASDEAIKNILAEKLWASLAFKLGLIRNQLAPIVLQYNNSYTRLLNQYGTLIDEDKGIYEIKDQQKKDKFSAEILELLEEIVIITYQSKISISDFEKAGPLPGAALVALAWVVGEEQ